jgi:ketosteroid isomerase-like protein
VDSYNYAVVHPGNPGYNKATGAKNGDAAAAMYIPDGVQVQSRGVATGRAAIRARYLDDWKTTTEQPASIEFAKAAEDGTILAAGNWHVVIQGANGPENLRGYFADILVQQDGTWLTKLEFDIDAKP